MSGLELLRVIVTAFERVSMPFMMTGSMAAAAHGAGRATMDIDVVIDATPDRLDALVDHLTSHGLYVSAAAARDALAHESAFNAIDVQTAWKVDLIIRKSRPFSKTEFARRTAIDFEGIRLWVATVEDLVVAKLEWAKLGESARQLEDVAKLVRAAGETIDFEYVNGWVQELGLVEQWDAVRRTS
jgi:hypothetical protein